MTFALSGLMLYAMWAIFGLMFVDFLINLFRNLSANSLTLMLDYLRDILSYVLPLMIVVNMMPLDPTGGWVMLIAYYVGAIAIIWNYLTSIRNRF